MEGKNIFITLFNVLSILRLTSQQTIFLVHENIQKKMENIEASGNHEEPQIMRLEKIYILEN
jgi:hypothetical protein